MINIMIGQKKVSMKIKFQFKFESVLPDVSNRGTIYYILKLLCSSQLARHKLDMMLLCSNRVVLNTGTGHISYYLYTFGSRRQ